jgi:excisionase family DNA binding protein
MARVEVLAARKSGRTTLEELPDAMRVEDAAAFLGISRNTAYAAVKSGEIPSSRFGKRIVVSKRALLEVLDGVAA